MAHPLCEYCQADGRVEPATVCDHDLPHQGDPEAFWDNTFTALCSQCHNSTKRRLERQFTGAELLEAIRLVKAGHDVSAARPRLHHVPNAGAILVWGPPCGGKTTWARSEAAKTGAIVYDLDDVAEGMGLPRFERTRAQAKMAMDRMMRNLAQHPADHRLIVIATAPTPARRRFWAELVNASQVRLVSATMAECIARVAADPQRVQHYGQQVEIIEGWFRALEAL